MFAGNSPELCVKQNRSISFWWAGHGAVLLGAVLILAPEPEPSRADELVTPAQNQETKSLLLLATAEQVHRLTREEAQRGNPTVIRGVVTCSLPEYAAVVLQDFTRGIYVDHLFPTLGEPPRLGELLEIEGETQPGEFAPSVRARRMTRLGTGTLPQPIRPTWDQLINGSLDTQYSEIQGIVTAVHSNVVTLLTHGGKIKTVLPGTNPDTLTQYESSLVRVRGCLFAAWDAKTHQVRVGEIRMFSASVSVDEFAPTDMFAISPKRVRELLLFDPQASALRRVKMSGQIVHRSDEEYYMMDGTNGLRFVPKESVELQEGDLAEVVGFPILSGSSPVLQEAVARKTGRSALPNPNKLPTDNLFLGENDSTLVQVEAVLLNLNANQTSLTLELQAGVRRFVARLDSRNGFVKSIPPGSRLELTGVYAGRGGNRAAGRDIDSFELLLNSPADITVLARPSWWTTRRVLWMLGGVTVVLLSVMVWVVTLKRRVSAQTQIIRQKIQRETILEERTRIAREFHDTLEQALVGIGMQLDAAKNLLSVSEVANESLEILDMARSMVRHGQEEARRSVWNLRTYALEQGDLPTALSQIAGHARNGSQVKIDLQVSGDRRPLPSRIEGHLLRIGQEATVNAVKHAQCKNIRLALQYGPQLTQLSIEDDGVGFNAKNATSSEAGHFGLLGMRERAEKIGGTLTISSKPGSGTKISVTVPPRAAVATSLMS